MAALLNSPAITSCCCAGQLSNISSPRAYRIGRSRLGQRGNSLGCSSWRTICFGLMAHFQLLLCRTALEYFLAARLSHRALPAGSEGQLSGMFQLANDLLRLDGSL